METYILLLRGVMPTGKNRVPMAALRERLGRAGLSDVRTYIQSGNVIARSDLGRAKVEDLVHTVIRNNFGGEIAVIARTAGEFAKIVRGVPFAAVDASRIYFTLLQTKPGPAAARAFAAADFSPEQVKLAGDVIYTLFATRYSDSKFNNLTHERMLRVAATTRNWNTMHRLVEMSTVTS